MDIALHAVSIRQKRLVPEFSGFNFERVETPDRMFTKSERVLLAEARIPPTKYSRRKIKWQLARRSESD